MGSRPPGSSVHGILQAGILEWAAVPFSRGSSQPRDQTQVSLITGRFVAIWATREAWGGDQMRTEVGLRVPSTLWASFPYMYNAVEICEMIGSYVLEIYFSWFFPIIFRKFIEMSNCQNLIIEHFHHPVLICNHSHSPPSSVGHHPSTFSLYGCLF